MRNWNSGISQHLAFNSRLSDYLWGIETFVDDKVFILAKRLSDYLWGIETIPWCLFLGQYACSQTTYEELKLWSSLNWWSWRYEGSQTTYEELKLQPPPQIHLPSLGLSDYLWGIETGWDWFRSSMVRQRSQTTYEELKHHLLCAIRESLSALRLPMRNWNDKQLDFWLSRDALRLPMRNWNFWHRVLCCARNSGSQTTYEELKLVESEETDRNDTALRLPMRNWNYRWFGTNWSYWRSRALRLPMRNWNATLKLTNVRSATLALRLPMRNWNAHMDTVGDKDDIALRLPMRNWNYEKNYYSIMGFIALRLPMRNWN